MNEELDRIVLSLREELFKEASELIKFRSVQGEFEEDAPFGKGVKKALEYALKLGEKYGFKVKNVDNYAGHVEFGDSGKLFGVLGHLDVVPEGTGWSVDPYGGVIKDGYLFGRGAIDDKAPTIAALFALRAVKELGIKPKNRVRIIFGTNEETGWMGVKHYFEHEEMPDWGVTPDADFPIIYAEKGIVNFEISAVRNPKPIKGDATLVSLKGGEASNMVIANAELILDVKNDDVIELIKNFKPQNDAHIETDIDGEKISVKAFGKSAHGSKPQEGVNAASALFELVEKIKLDDEELNEYLKKINEKIGYETNGKSLGIAGSDDVSGDLTVNLGVVEITNSTLKLTLNIRYPIFFNVNMIESQIKEALNNMSVTRTHDQGPLYVSPESKLVKLLSEVYEDVTKEKAYLIAIGGGTYARAIPNAVAFGPLFPGRESTEHQADERIALDDLLMAARIYAQLLYRVL